MFICVVLVSPWEEYEGDEGLLGAGDEAPLGPDEALRLDEQVGERQAGEQRQVRQGEHQVPDTLDLIR